MKKILLTAATIITASAISLNANAQNATDNVTLNVKLHPIQTLIVNSGQKAVDLNYVNKDDYANGVSSDQADHLTVYSTGGFEVKVKSSAAELTGTYGSIDANSITITPSAGSSNSITGATYTALQLGATEQAIITSSTGGVDKNFNIQYKGADANQYVNKYNNSENPTVYTTTVTYTIVAQ